MFKKLFLGLLLAFSFNFSSAYSSQYLYFYPLDCLIKFPNDIRSEKDIRVVPNIIVYSMHKEFVKYGDAGLENNEQMCKVINEKVMEFDLMNDKEKDFEIFLYERYLEEHQKEDYTLDLADDIYLNYLENITRD